MVLTNAEKQARWRAAHAERRRNVQRIATILMRRRRTNKHISELAQRILMIIKLRSGKALQRELEDNLQEMTKRALHRARQVREERQWRDDWLAAHPDMTVKDYRRLRKTAVFEWLITRENARRAAYWHEAIVKPMVDRQAIAWALDG
jgi:hypothetical protein